GSHLTKGQDRCQAAVKGFCICKPVLLICILTSSTNPCRKGDGPCPIMRIPLRLRHRSRQDSSINCVSWPSPVTADRNPGSGTPTGFGVSYFFMANVIPASWAWPRSGVSWSIWLKPRRTRSGVWSSSRVRSVFAAALDDYGKNASLQEAAATTERTLLLLRPDDRVQTN